MTEFFLVSSLGLNAALFAYCYKLSRRPPAKPHQLTISAEDLLHDLTRGPAVIRVEVIDAKNLFLRRPT